MSIDHCAAICKIDGPINPTGFSDSVKDMARLFIVVLIAIVGSIDCAEVNDDRMSGSDWARWYDRLFAHDRSYDLDEEGAMSILLKLNKGSYQLIDENKNKTVRFWYDANIYNLEHCTERYVNSLYTHYVRHDPSTAYGIGIVYSFSNRHVIQYCYDRFTGMDIGSLNEDKRARLFELGALFNELQDLDRQKPEIESRLGDAISSLVDLTARKNQPDFVDAWRSGVCNEVLTRLNEPDMHDYSSIENFLATIDYKKREKVSRRTNDWVSAIEACKYFSLDENISNMWTYVQIK